MISAVNDFLDDLRGGKMTEAPVVRVEQGQLQGKVVESPSGKSFFSFQGIPYAKPPTGSLRFKAPQPAEPWDDIRDATAEGNVAAQIEPFIHKQYIGDENCLFLNVYTPNLDGEFLPVMVFIHGGKFKYGSGNSEMYGPDFLVEKDIILVTVNYRLGALGFLGLDTPEVPGNAGLKDIALALRWVKENINNFGGNSGNITVCGYSAGGVATSILTASLMSKDLINKAILQSGTAVSSRLLQKNPVDNAKNLAKSLGCESDDVDEILEFLSTTPVKEIVEATEKLEPDCVINKNVLGLVFGPIVEKEFPGVDAVITESFTDLLTSGRIAKIPTMIGTDTLEFTLERFTDDLQAFIPEDLNIGVNTDLSVGIADKIKFLYFEGSHTDIESLQEYSDLLSDVLINVDIHRHVKYLFKESSKPIYYYKFDFVGELNLTKSKLSALGLDRPGHSDELGYLFKNVHQNGVEPTPQDVKTRERMLRLWSNFAKSGNPTPDENHYLTVTWLPVTKDNLYYLRIGNELQIGSNPEAEKMEFWEDLYNKHYKTWEQYWARPEPKEKTLPQTSAVAENVTEEVANNSEETETVNTVDDVDQANVTENVEQSEHKVDDSEVKVADSEVVEDPVVIAEAPVVIAEEPVVIAEEPVVIAEEPVVIVEDKIEEPVEIVKESNGVTLQEDIVEPKLEMNGNGVVKARTSNEIKMVQNGNGQPKDVIRANDPPEDDLPKNIGVRSKFVNFFESLGGKKNPTPDENHYLTVTWLPVTKDNLYYLRIGNELQIGSNPEAEKMEFWEDLYNKHYKTWEQYWARPEPKEKTLPQTSVVAENVTEEAANNSEETETVNTVDDVDQANVTENVEQSAHKVDDSEVKVTDSEVVEDPVVIAEAPVVIAEEPVVIAEEPVVIAEEPVVIIEDKIEEPVEIVKESNGVTLQEDVVEPKIEMNGNGVVKARTSNEIKMVQNGNGQPKDVIRANDPPEDDLPKNIGVRSKFVNFFESLGGKK